MSYKCKQIKKYRNIGNKKYEKSYQQNYINIYKAYLK